jgi:hypothetical protein
VRQRTGLEGLEGIAASIKNMQLQTADKGWSSGLVVGRGADKSSPQKNHFVMKCYIGPRIWTDSLDKKPMLRKWT